MERVKMLLLPIRDITANQYKQELIGDRCYMKGY
jgi:hypothetical protein